MLTIHYFWKKLSCYKVSDNFLHLMKSYLDDRTQVVFVNNKLSDIDHVKCGVPQGVNLRATPILDFYQ